MNASSYTGPTTPFHVGDWVVHPDSGHLHREGVDVKVEPKAMEVLIYMAQHPGEVISHEALKTIAWAGTVVGYDAVSGSIVKLRKALGDDSRNPRYIKTISKRGYQLIAPVSHGGSVAQDPATSETASAVQPAKNTKKSGKLFTTGVGLVVVIGLLFFLVVVPDILKPSIWTSAKIPSIVVLPFKNLSDDPQQEYFSDGISEDIITDLSRISNLSVIARNSSFAYKEIPATIQDIAKELGAEYALKGSVRKAGDRVRITAQLIEAETARSLWADRYDRRLVNIFELQDEIRNKIVSALSIQLVGAEAEHLARRSTNSFEAYDLFLKGRRLYNEHTRESLVRAEALYRQAIELDPEFARAYGALGITLSRQFQFDFAANDRDELLNEAYEVAQKAVSIEPTSPQVQWALGFVHLWRGEFEQAAKVVEKSVTLSANFADGWALLSQINNVLGQGNEALRFIRKGMALNPRYTWEYAYSEGRAYYNIGEYEKAVDTLQKALKRNENSLYPRLYLAASYFRTGNVEDAAWEVTRLEVTNPEISLARLEQSMPLPEGEHRSRLFEDLRQAGLSQ